MFWVIVIITNYMDYLREENHGLCCVLCVIQALGIRI